MWYPLTVSEAPEAEPVAVDDVKQQCRIDHSDDDGYLAKLIERARSHTEMYCGTRLATQTVVANCDGFADLVRLPFGPVQSIESITYVDSDGAIRTLPTDVYEPRVDGLDSAIVLKFGQGWPAIRAGSRIAVTAGVGYEDLPPAIEHALLMLIGDWYANRDAVPGDLGGRPVVVPMGYDDLLANFRMNA
jgi:uncharacterized phiE125 gp8 family phage protein